MKREVEAYRDHTARMKEKIDFKIEVSIIWGTGCLNDYENQVIVWVDKDQLSNNPGVKSSRGVITPLDPGSRVLKLDDQITIDAGAHATSGTFSSRDRRSQGIASDQVITVKEMLGEGKTIDLNKFDNQVKLKITLPEAPPLPAWINKK
jgi:hypothetical protein